MIRRTLTAAIAVVGLAAVTPLAASAAMPSPVVPDKFNGPASKAQAAGTCALSVPTRVAIGRPEIFLQGKITGTCNNPAAGSAWYLNHPAAGTQPVNIVIFDRTQPNPEVPYGQWWVPSEHPIGNMTFNGIGSYNPDGTTNTQNRVGVTVKLAAGAWISSSRKADVVTLKGTSLLYSVSNNNYFKRSAGGVFQFREIGQSNWQTLKSVWTNSKGEVTLAYRYSKTRDYRFALYSTPISWDLGSATTRR